MRVLQCGNFEPTHSTENDLHRTLVEHLHVDVDQLQEQDVEGWKALPGKLLDGQYQLVLWTRTKSLSDQVPVELRRRMQIQARLAGVPTVGYHLDRWWGLGRQDDVYNDPFFRCDYVCTADGHHDLYWSAAGINHVWVPPGIGQHNAHRGKFRAEYECDIAFVGSWDSYGHTEWAHRTQLVKWLRRNYGTKVKFFPERGQPAVRGEDLADLYASCKITVGDSCLVPGADGKPMTKYCSDRVFESIGRGAYLIHPDVYGITDCRCDNLCSDHLATWPLGNWDALKVEIDKALQDELLRARKAAAGFNEVFSSHTYTSRLWKLFSETLGFSYSKGEWS